MLVSGLQESFKQKEKQPNKKRLAQIISAKSASFPGSYRSLSGRSTSVPFHAYDITALSFAKIQLKS